MSVEVAYMKNCSGSRLNYILPKEDPQENDYYYSNAELTYCLKCLYSILMAFFAFQSRHSEFWLLAVFEH